jgi:hypothetical protein
LTDLQRIGYGAAGEWLALRYLKEKHGELVSENSWKSGSRNWFSLGRGDDSLGYDLSVIDGDVEWLYEVKASTGENWEFDFTSNERRVATSCRADEKQKYRILYVPRIGSSDEWRVIELPNPCGTETQEEYITVKEAATRLRFAPKQVR